MIEFIENVVATMVAIAMTYGIANLFKKYFGDK